MNIKSLKLKNTLINESTGESYFDLTAPSFKYKDKYGIKGLHYVSQDQEGRIDLIAVQYFGNTEYVDAICVINNIFNPFSIKEGDVLIIPNLKNEYDMYMRPDTNNKEDVVKSQYNNSLQSKKDKTRIQRLIDKGKGKENSVENPLPTNILQPNQNTKEFADGKIKLGTNLKTK